MLEMISYIVRNLTGTLHLKLKSIKCQECDGLTHRSLGKMQSAFLYILEHFGMENSIGRCFRDSADWTAYSC